MKYFLKIFASHLIQYTSNYFWNQAEIRKAPLIRISLSLSLLNSAPPPPPASFFQFVWKEVLLLLMRNPPPNYRAAGISFFLPSSLPWNNKPWGKEGVCGEWGRHRLWIHKQSGREQTRARRGGGERPDETFQGIEQTGRGEGGTQPTMALNRTLTRHLLAKFGLNFVPVRCGQTFQSLVEIY